VAAKQILRAFYDQRPRFSYFTGCSDGGHEALMEAQRVPDDYDGIVAGASANYWTHQSAAWVWEARAALDDPASFIPQAADDQPGRGGRVPGRRARRHLCASPTGKAYEGDD
jgi:hypothetical protein